MGGCLLTTNLCLQFVIVDLTALPISQRLLTLKSKQQKDCMFEVPELPLPEDGCGVWQACET